MKSIDIQSIETNYEIIFNGHVQDLSLLRKKLRITQSSMAFYCNVSLRKIQLFESYKSKDYFLIYAYKEILK